MFGRAKTPRRGIRRLMGNVEIVLPPDYWVLPLWKPEFLSYCRKLRGRIPHFLFFVSLQNDFYYHYFLAQSRHQSLAGGVTGSIPIEMGVFAGITSTERRSFERFALKEAELRPDQASERFATIAQYLRSGGNKL